MCDKPSNEYRGEDPRIHNQARQEAMAGQQLKNSESLMVYELKQRREWLFRQLTDVQAAIDAVNKVG